jgi:hypothetical protein
MAYKLILLHVSHVRREPHAHQQKQDEPPHERTLPRDDRRAVSIFVTGIGGTIIATLRYAYFEPELSREILCFQSNFESLTKRK